MFLHVVKAKFIKDYVIQVEFNNGVSGEVDLKNELDGEMFEPLRNRKLFKSFKVDPILHTIVWPNGADLAPEFLHDNLKILA